MSNPTRTRLWLRLALGLGVLLALTLAGLVALSLWTGGKFGARLEAIRSAGDPASIAELAPKPIPADQNAAAIIDGAKQQIDAFAQAHGAFYKSHPGGVYEFGEHPFVGTGTPPDQLQAIRAIVDQFPQLDAAIAQAAACEAFAPVADFSLDSVKFSEKSMERIMRFRALARFKTWRIKALVGEGQLDDAVAGGIELLKLSRLHEAEPTLTGYLVSIAVRMTAIEALYDALTAGPVSAGMHAALDAELAQQDDAGQLGRVLRTERAFAISSIDAQAAQSGKWASGFARVLLNRQYLGVLDLFDALLEVIDLPQYDAQSPHQPDGLISKAQQYGPLAGLLAPAFQAAYTAHSRDAALVRSLRAYNALRAYADRHGREASGLAELDLPTEATVDPFTGQLLTLKPTPGGWIVYSLGTNGADDGGALSEQKDVGVGP